MDGWLSTRHPSPPSGQCNRNCSRHCRSLCRPIRLELYHWMVSSYRSVCRFALPSSATDHVLTRLAPSLTRLHGKWSSGVLFRLPLNALALGFSAPSRLYSAVLLFRISSRHKFLGASVTLLLNPALSWPSPDSRVGCQPLCWANVCTDYASMWRMPLSVIPTDLATNTLVFVPSTRRKERRPDCPCWSFGQYQLWASCSPSIGLQNHSLGSCPVLRLGLLNVSFSADSLSIAPFPRNVNYF